LCIFKFQDDLFIKKFLLRIDCKSTKEILQKDVQNLVSKQIFARWQALSAFDFDIEFIKGVNNSFRDCALSAPYLACNFNSLHKFKPSDLTMPNNCPKVSRLKGISFVEKFCLSLLRILSPNNFGRPAINRSFQNTASASSLFRTLERNTSLYQR